MENSDESGFCSVTGIYNSLFSSPLPHSSLPLSLPEFLLHNTPHRPSNPAFLDAFSDKTLTYADLTSLTAATASALLAAGVRRGDVVLLISPNSIYFPALSIGIMAAGAVFSTANHLLTRREIHAQVEDSRPVLILTTGELRSKFDGLNIPRPPVLIDQFLSTLVTPAAADNIALIDCRKIELDDAAVLMYSSGTTGRSKGVICTHRNLVYMAGVLRHVWGSTREDIYLCVVPLFHMFGFSVFVCGAVAAGAAVVVMQRYSLEGVLEAVERRGVTRIPAVPPMVVQLVRMVHVAGDYELKSLREVICSGAPLAKEHVERFAACYPDITLSQV
ncbi:putative 4-coumarate--CoA ligase-like 8 [Platanthera guangdongensis]|uniref:4-coumarate--CoA ligase n=1 Tax=Platanthera guangdongensis TaxID=2320717 RepID=A0ABR2MFJ3_9ASPA